MGRMLVLGHGRELYSRAKHLEVARAATRGTASRPAPTDHDADRLVGWYTGPADDPVGGPLYPPVHAFVMAPLALISDPYLSYRVAQGVMLALVFVAGAGVRYLTRRPLVVVRGNGVSAPVPGLPRGDRPGAEQHAHTGAV